MGFCLSVTSLRFKQRTGLDYLIASWVIGWPFIIISKKTISWRQVRRKNWWLAWAAFPPSRCRSYVWIVTDKTGKNDLIEISFVSTAWPWQTIHRIFATSLLCNKKSISLLSCLPRKGKFKAFTFFHRWHVQVSQIWNRCRELHISCSVVCQLISWRYYFIHWHPLNLLCLQTGL